MNKPSPFLRYLESGGIPRFSIVKDDFQDSLLLTSTLHVCRVQRTTKLVSESEDHVSIIVVLKRSLAQPGTKCSGCSHTRAEKSDSRCLKAHHSQASESYKDAGCWSEGPVCPALESSGQGILRILSYHLHLPRCVVTY